MTSLTIQRSASTFFELHESAKIRFYSLPGFEWYERFRKKGK